MDFVTMLFDTSGFPARWHCGRWSDFLGWLHIGSDFAIFGAYLAIPFTLSALVLQRRDLPFHTLFWLFSAFIVACGLTHLNEAIIFWHPIYRLQGVVKLGTGLVSWATVVALVPAARIAMTLRTPEQLEREVRERTDALLETQAELRAARDELENRVAARTVELERSNRDLAQFAHSASHDLQEPLRMVANFTELLKEEYGDTMDAEANEYMDYANSGARRMQRLLHDLLAFAQVGRESTEKARADLGEAVEAARANLHIAIEKSGATLEMAGPLPELAVPPTLLTQVMQNLLGNAIKFSRPGVAPHVEVSARSVLGGHRVSVRDDGIGFDPAHAERIFSVFRRLNHSDAYEGNGIGLAICQRIVERYGGRIWAESRPGEGATFCFELPEPASEPLESQPDDTSLA